ncbi:CLCA_X family protein [Shewanella sp. MF08487]|uniref:CLCA_X family protein n=1 Tax=Shewanella sp. MF08487 TaxID=3434873 RepID=UPI003D7921F7
MLINQQYTRHGPDYRFGEQVTFLDIKQTFGFSHVRVGRWVTREESRIAANLVFDSLADLAFILKLPPLTLGLRQTVSLAFGHGGQKGVQAHYAPSTRELALAKNAGAGALAHEFWHAFDHYIAEKSFQSSTKRFQCASDLWLADLPIIEHPLNARLSDIFKMTFLTGNNDEPHDYVRRAIALDKKYQMQYFSRPTEMMARAFEACIESYTEISNPYLVSGTCFSALAKEGGYPDESHRQRIFQVLINYFEPLGIALGKTSQ